MLISMHASSFIHIGACNWPNDKVHHYFLSLNKMEFESSPPLRILFPIQKCLQPFILAKKIFRICMERKVLQTRELLQKFSHNNFGKIIFQVSCNGYQWAFLWSFSTYQVSSLKRFLFSVQYIGVKFKGK